MKTTRILLIGLYMLLGHQSYAQDNFPVDSLKKIIINYFDNDIKLWFHLDNDELRGKSGLKIIGKAFLNDTAIVIPTNEGNVCLSFKKTVYNTKEKNARVHNTNITIPEIFEVNNDDFNFCISLTKKNYKNAFILNTKTEKLVAVWNLLQIKLKTSIYDEKYNQFKDLNAGIKKLSNETISEEQRKLIVQANYYNDNKYYKKALESYELAVKLNQLNCTAAYFNMALIAAQIKDYPYAIFNMKKYLLLVPNSEDTRKEKDKIYEWETEINDKISAFTEYIRGYKF